MSDKPLQAQQDTIRLPVYDVEGFRTDWPLLDQTLVNCFAEVIRNPVTGEGEVVATKRSGITRVGSLSFAAHLTDVTTAFPIANYVVSNLYDVYITAYWDTTHIRIIQYRPVAGTTTLLGSIVIGNAYDKVYISHGWTGDELAPTITLLLTWESGVGTSSKGYYAEVASGVFATASLTEIIAAQAPWTLGKITRGPILQLNQQFYVAELNGKIYGTGTTKHNTANVKATDTTVGAFQGWTDPLNFISSLVPDQFHCLVRFKHHIVAVGKTSMQFFSDVGNAVNPGISIQGTDQAFVKFGAVNGYLVANVDDILYWVAYGVDSTIGLWKLDGYTPVKLSTKRIDNQLREFAKATTQAIYYSRLSAVMFNSKKHIIIPGLYAYTRAYANEPSCQLANSTQLMPIGASTGWIAAYSLEDKTWWYIRNGAGVFLFFPVASYGNPLTPQFNQRAYRQYIIRGDLVNNNKNEYIYSITEESYTDDYAYNEASTVTPVAGGYIMTAIQFNNVQFSTEKRKRINKAKVIMGTNLSYNSADTNIYSLCLVSAKTNAVDISDPFGDVTVRPIQIPNSFHRYYWNNLGMSRNWCFLLLEKSNMPFSVKYLELDLAQGTA